MLGVEGKQNMSTGQPTPVTTPEPRLRASQRPEVAKGEARIPREVLPKLGLTEGQTIALEYQGKRAQVRVRTPPTQPDRLECNPEDLRTLGAPDGAEIVLKRP